MNKFIVFTVVLSILGYYFDINNKAQDLLFQKNNTKIYSAKNQALLDYFDKGGKPIQENINNIPFNYTEEMVQTIVNNNTDLQNSISNEMINLYEQHASEIIPELYITSSINDLSADIIINNYYDYDRLIKEYNDLSWEELNTGEVRLKNYMPDKLKNSLVKTEQKIYISQVPQCSLAMINDIAIGTNYSKNYIEHKKSDFHILFETALSSINHKLDISDYEKILKEIASNYSDSDYYYLRKLNEKLYEDYIDGKLDYPLVFVDYSDGCGAGEVLVTITSYPKNAKIRYIPQFFAHICQAHGMDVFNLENDENHKNQCIFWQDVHENSASVAGRYYYQAFYKGIRQTGTFQVLDIAADSIINIDLINNENSPFNIEKRTDYE